MGINLFARIKPTVSPQPGDWIGALRGAGVRPGGGAVDEQGSGWAAGRPRPLCILLRRSHELLRHDGESGHCPGGFGLPILPAGGAIAAAAAAIGALGFGLPRGSCYSRYLSCKRQVSAKIPEGFGL